MMPLEQFDVVSLCDLTGEMVKPWAAAGARCLCIDTQHSIRKDRLEYVGSGLIVYRWADIRAMVADDLGGARIRFAFPPCTHLAVSGARDFEKKGLCQLIDALGLVEACRKLLAWDGVPWMIENPVGRLSTCWRKPNFIFDPCDYGDPYTKKTCLWTGGGFVMPPKNRVEPVEGSKMHKLPPGPDRANLRSATPPGFARAVFEANRHHLGLAAVAA